MKKWITIGILAILVIGMVLISGCTNTGSTIPVATATPQIVYVTVLVTPTPTTEPVPRETGLSTTFTTEIPTTIAPDPILHRWVRQYIHKVNGTTIGYEFKFYSDGSVNYKEGTATMVSDNIMITPVIEASGTWAKVGENKYLVKILPTAVSGAQLLREYTLVPAHEEVGYPGIVIRDHIESSFETDAINKGESRGADEMYYPELAKID